jgi:hypothetical protein
LAASLRMLPRSAARAPASRETSPTARACAASRTTHASLRWRQRGRARAPPAPTPPRHRPTARHGSARRRSEARSLPNTARATAPAARVASSPTPRSGWLAGRMSYRHSVVFLPDSRRSSAHHSACGPLRRVSASCGGRVSRSRRRRFGRRPQSILELDHEFTPAPTPASMGLRIPSYGLTRRPQLAGHRSRRSRGARRGSRVCRRSPSAAGG